MKPPTINLARRPFRNNTLYYGVFGACAILLVAATGYNASEFSERGAQLQALRDQMEQRTAAYRALFDEVEQMKKDIATVNLASLDSKSGFANGLILARFFSWSSLFDRMEDIIPDDVKIRSIRPSISPKGIEIQIDGMARAADGLYQFEAALDHSEYFSSVYPVSEDSRQTKNEINFDLVMDYVPGGSTGSQPESPTAYLPVPEPKPDAGAGEGEAGATGAKAEEAAAGADGDRPAPVEPSGHQVVAEAGHVPAPQTAAPPVAQHVPPDPSPAQVAGVGQTPPPSAPAPSAGEAQPIAGTPQGAPGPATADGGAQPSAAAPQPEKPLSRITNGELFRTRGQDEFLKMWGDLKPREPRGADADLTNQAFIAKHGVEEFVKVRGTLTRNMQTKGVQNPQVPKTP